ncbi:hypothetical protein [Paenibacillus sp. BIHB 4019]|uniref:hypothetical protein n=1 Tax=Paenibacillus sp. BIHB 4019 TaxID=1870819 RepID=UPI001559363A|nr:hypothetical protein [Paenibacillus sp. BIHB 4019]
MTNLKFDPSKQSHRLIMSALFFMFYDEGLTIQEVQEVLEDIKRQAVYALLDGKGKS